MRRIKLLLALCICPLVEHFWWAPWGLAWYHAICCELPDGVPCGTCEECREGIRCRELPAHAGDGAELASACPRCGAESEDLDGLGVLSCDRCGYCTHPARDGDGTGGMVCGICGDVESAPLAGAEHG